MAGPVASFMICFFYACAAVVMNILNKVVFYHFSFKLPLVLMWLQFAVFLAISPFLYLATKNNEMSPYRIPMFSMSDFNNSILTSLLFMGNVLCGLWALTMVNIPMFLALRRLSIVFIFA